jgi:hypothetical protein
MLIHRAGAGAFALLVAFCPAATANASGTVANTSPSGNSASPTPTSGARGHGTLPRATFGIAPATPHQVDNRSEFSYVLGPTMHYTDYAAVRNFSPTPLKLTISAVDLGNDSSGNIEAGVSQADAKDAGRWITLEHATTVRVPGQTSVGPGQVIVPFTITVPQNASVGDHAAEILATLTTRSRGANNQNVLLHQRIGARVFVRVPGNPEAALAIRNLSVQYSGGSMYPFTSGKLHVQYTLVNTGNVTLSVTQAGSVSGWFGAHVSASAEQAPPVPALLPGGSASADYTLGDVPPEIMDHFKVTASATYATDTTLNQAKQTEVAALAVSGSKSFWAIPWLLIIIVVVLILLAVGGRRWRRERKRRTPQPRHRHKPTELQSAR